jgi:hypothetical protein
MKIFAGAVYEADPKKEAFRLEIPDFVMEALGWGPDTRIGVYPDLTRREIRIHELGNIEWPPKELTTAKP